MALKEYKLNRPTDETEFTMMLNEDDKTKYEKAKWKVTETRRENPTTPRDLAAKAAAAARTSESDEDATATK